MPEADSLNPGLRSVLWYLLVGTRGGPNRLRILERLTLGPINAYALAEELRLDYRTVRHHLRLLESHGVVVRPIGHAYASPYILPEHLTRYLVVFRTGGREAERRVAVRARRFAEVGG